MESYLAYFPTFELLTPDEEKFFARLAQQGDQLGRDRLILHNVRLVAAEALRYFKGKTPDDTLIVSVISEGMFGLIRAVERFDWARGFRFSTYATHWIRRFIYRGSNGLRFIRLPHYIHGILARMGPTQAVLEQELGREPEDKEMADEMGLREGAYNLAVQASAYTNIVHPTPDPTREGSDGDYLDYCNECPRSIDPVEAVIAGEAKDLLLAALRRLPKRLATVVRMRYSIESDDESDTYETRSYTLQEIGVHLSLSRERVRQLEAEAKDRLRAILSDKGDDEQ